MPYLLIPLVFYNITIITRIHSHESALKYIKIKFLLILVLFY